MFSSPRALRVLLIAGVLAGCGARTELRARATDAREASADVSDVADVPDARDAFDVVDASDAMDVPDVQDVVDVQDAQDVVDVPDAERACMPVDDRCGPVEVCGNGEDDNCNGAADEGCPCTPGAVQSCFGGPPGRRHVGACSDGMQVCLMRATWGTCAGGINPQPPTCNGLDNVCNGCSQQTECPISCPGPGDPRVTDGTPLQDYPLHGGLFFPAPAAAWQWSVRGGACDDFSRRPSFELRDANTRDATFFPRLSGDYTVTLTVTTEGGRTLTCSWVVHVQGLGLRVEMCYPENETLDLDLYLHSPLNRDAWYTAEMGSVQNRVIESSSCSWANCEPLPRGPAGMGVDWGYARSPLSFCVDGPQGMLWTEVGSCSDPRLDIDNNLAEGTGLPENINVDTPRDGELFRVMVQNFSGPLAHPLVNVYCGGRRVATYGAPPDALAGYQGENGNSDIGMMWRVVDVTTHVDAAGNVLCDTQQLHPAGAASGYWLTSSDPTY